MWDNGWNTNYLLKSHPILGEPQGCTCAALWKANRYHSDRIKTMTHVADYRCGEMVTPLSYLLTQHCNCRALRNAIANKRTKCWFTPLSPSLRYRKRGSWNTFNITSCRSIHLDSGWPPVPLHSNHHAFYNYALHRFSLPTVIYVKKCHLILVQVDLLSLFSAWSWSLPFRKLWVLNTNGTQEIKLWAGGPSGKALGW